MQSGTHDNNRLFFLDGIRGWGALSVLLYHVFIDALPVSPNLAKMLAPIPLFNGHLAVLIFFVISGFSLSIHYFRTHDRDALINISLGRYLRLAVPILITSALVYSCFKLGLVVDTMDRPERIQDLLKTAPSAWDVVRFSLYDVFFKYDSSKTLIPPLWTMQTEIWGSCLVIGTLLVVPRLGRRFAIYGAVALVSYCISPTYSAFVIGMVFAEVYASSGLKKHRKSLGIIAALMLAPALILIWHIPALSVGVPPTQHTYNLIAALILSFSLIFNARFAKFLSGRLSRFLGKISFPLYLIHALILYTFSAHMYKLAGPATTDGIRIAINLSTVIVSIIAAYFLIPADRLGIRASKAFAKFMRGNGRVRQSYTPGVVALDAQGDPPPSLTPR
jgi:peptidoglycan/LPS O-acetylase OafA/YrhL